MEPYKSLFREFLVESQNLLTLGGIFETHVQACVHQYLSAPPPPGAIHVLAAVDLDYTIKSLQGNL